MGNTESNLDDGGQVDDELKLGWCNESRQHKRDLRTVSAVPAVQTVDNIARPRGGDLDREEAMERVRRQGERNTSFASGQSQILGKHSYYPDTISAAGITRIAQYTGRQFLRTCSCSVTFCLEATWHTYVCAWIPAPYSSPARLRPLSELCSLWGWAAANAVSETSAAATAARYLFQNPKLQLLLFYLEVLFVSTKESPFQDQRVHIRQKENSKYCWSRHHQQNDMCEFSVFFYVCIFDCKYIARMVSSLWRNVHLYLSLESFIFIFSFNMIWEKHSQVAQAGSSQCPYLCNIDICHPVRVTSLKHAQIS